MLGISVTPVISAIERYCLLWAINFAYHVSQTLFCIINWYLSLQFIMSSFFFQVNDRPMVSTYNIKQMGIYSQSIL